MKAKGWESQHKTPATPTPTSLPISFKKPKSNPKSKSNTQLRAYINPEFTDRRHWNIQTTYICSLSSAATTTTSASSWLYAAVDDEDQHPLHPLTFKPHPITLHLLTYKTSLLTSFNHSPDFPFDKIIIPPKSTTVDGASIVVLHGGGRLLGRLPPVSGQNSGHWVELSENKFDDIIVFRGDTYVVDREGNLYVINNYVKLRKLRLGKMVAARPAPETTGGVGWRNRFVEGLRHLYLVVRVEERVFRVYKLMKLRRSCYYWREGDWFDDGEVVLFVSKQCGFSLNEFVGREYEGFCLVFSESGFQKYGDDGGWVSSDEDGFGVFRLCDERYGRVGESVDFPEIDWSPPSWIFDVGEPDKDGSKNEDEQEGMNEQEGMEEQVGMEEHEERSDSDIRVLEDEEMQSDANVGGDTSLQEDVPPSLFSSISAVEEEVTRTLLCMNGGIEPTDKECSRKSKNTTLLAPRACTSSSTAKGYKGDSATTKFEGFDIKSDLVPILLKIWGKHGNIIENSTIHSRDLIARALELLAAMVQILENNSVESLSDCQADYLSSTLSDLKIMSLNVDWLSSFVEKAVKLHKRKALVDSLNKLGQLSSQVKESRAMLLDKVAKLTEEENKLKKEMAKVSEAILFSELVKFDEPLGLGLT